MIPGNINTDLISGDEGGYQISRSLRFNSADSAYLSRTPASAGNRKTWTWAGWVKNTCSTATTIPVTLLSARNGAGAGIGEFFWLAINNIFTAGGHQIAAGDGNVNYLVSTASFRDPSAWYHIVCAYDSTQATADNRLRLYVNGTEITVFNTNNRASLTQNSDGVINRTSIEHRMGLRVSEYSNCYLADVHFIDGQALTPSSFGQFDANGEWQPQAYSGSYGTNGFRLDFSDNSAATATTLGKDRAGSNNWTPNNLSVQAGNGRYVSQVSGTPYNATYPIVNMFDGLTTTYIAASGTSTTWTPTGGLSFTKLRVRLYQDSGTGQMTFNWSGGSYVLSFTNATANYTWIDVTSNVTSPVTSVQWSTPGIAGPYVVGWEVNDVQLIDYSLGYVNDSLVDTPTSYGTDTGVGGEVRGNYCTWNPLEKDATTVLSNGNLNAASIPSSAWLGATFAAASGKWYYEITTVTGQFLMLGVADYAVAQNSKKEYTNTGTYYYYGSNGQLRVNGVNTAFPDSNTYTFANNDVIGVAFDCDAGTVNFYRNGSKVGGASNSITGLSGKLLGPALSAGSGSQECIVNFGQRPFAYTAPSGFKALCDTNLPAPTIAKPSTVMDVRLYTGTGSSLTPTSTLGFNPDLIWIKSRSAATDHALYDAVRGAQARLESNTIDAEVTSDGGVTAFNSAGFTVGTLAQVNTSSATYAAWAWDAGSSTVTNTQGSITSSVRANPSAGFSIVTYTGTGANATVGHGLNAKPALILFKSRDENRNWVVYSGSLGATKHLLLNLTDGEATSSIFFNNTEPTSSVFSLGPLVNINNTGLRHVAYCFAPVAGYSAFGSYTGNGSADGPFVYTGFRPRWVMVKATSGATQWFIYDAARSPGNISDLTLLANSSAGGNTYEGMSISLPIDILSNGFKLRYADAGGYTNYSTWNYVYAAFAENPFQYARAR